MKFLAKQGGITNDDINRIVLTEKQYKKKHKKETIDSINSWKYEKAIYNFIYDADAYIRLRSKCVTSKKY